MRSESDYRLPRTVIPRRYDLVVEPDLEAFTFHGSVRIGIDVVEPTDTVHLNAVDLDLADVAIEDSTGVVRRAVSVEHKPEFERAALAFGELLDVGEHTLSIDFSGELNDRLRGFYRSTYTDTDGTEHVLATTQFEATDARRAFPCWDEPDLKAVFGVTLVIPNELTAVSCGPEISSELVDGGKRRVRFGDTMRLSTYLVAFIVGDLEATDPVDVDGVPLRVLHTLGKSHLVEFALEAGEHALRYFSDYYGMPYPGGKLDMVAIPDFAAGAMENLGAITYRETPLLVDPAVPTQPELESVAATVAHEIAHMWFGDLVTMRWWNGTWLKEAFATFMEMKCTDAFRPQWKTWLGFGPTRDAAMEIDALEATRSIEFPVHSPDDANAMFDTITYEKGSAVLRMLEQYLGENVFRKGIAHYLTEHAFGNTETDDLWRSLQAASGQPVGDIAHEWIFQGGLPQVHVEPVEGGVRLSHDCFRYLGEAPHQWSVPVRYRVGDRHDRVLVGDEPVVVETDEPVVVNAGGSGFYRTRYDAELLDSLTRAIGDAEPEERFSLVADSWANVLAGDTSIDGYLEVVAGLGGETEPSVWEAALGGLGEIDRIVSSDDRHLVAGFVRRLLRPPAVELGWTPDPDEGDLTRRLRGLVHGALGTLGADPDTRHAARSFVDTWLATPNAVDGEVANAALSIAARSGGRAEFDRFVAARDEAESPQDKVRLLRAATQIPDAEASLDVVDMVLDGRVRRQDSYWVIARLLGNRDTGVAVWRRVRSDWAAILDAVPEQSAHWMLNLIHHRTEPDVASDITEFFEANPIKGAEQLVNQQLERLAVRVALRERERSRLAEAFSLVAG